MKIRTGFVSNSSSSSFVAWGVSIDKIQIPDGVDEWDYFEENGFTLGGQEQDFVGLTVRTIENDYSYLKVGEIRGFVATKLNQAFGTHFSANEIAFDQEGWYNG